MAALTIPTKFTAVDKFSSKVNKMGNSVQRFGLKAEASLARSERAFRRMTSPLRSLNGLLGGFGAAIGGALIVAGIGNAISIFKEFEQANADLAAVITTATKPELAALQKNALRLGATTAKTATEIVGLQETLGRRGFKAPAILNMTQAIIFGANAMKADLSETADLTGAVISTFDKFGSVDTPAIMDKMTAASQRTALTFEKLQTALPIVGGAANAIGVPFEKTLALLGKLSDAGLDASMSSTALRNIFIKSKAAGKDYGDIIKSIGGEQDALTAAVEAFGVRAGVPATVLSGKLADVDVLTKLLTNDIDGLAEASAKVRMATLEGSITLLNSAYSGFILNVENGNGQLADFLKLAIRGATDVLSLVAGVAKAEFRLTGYDLKVREVANSMIFWGEAIGGVIGALILWKALMIVAPALIFAYKLGVGISTVLLGLNTFALRGNVVALGVLKVVTWLATTATGAFATALGLAGLPIYAVILAIIALVASITVIIMKWDEWGAAVTLFLSIFFPAIGLIILMIQSFRNQWDNITNAFKTEGMIAGFKQIGVAIIDSILMPLQQMFELINEFTGADFAKSAAVRIEKFRSDIGVAGVDSEIARKANIGNTPLFQESFIPNSVEVLNPKKDQATSISKTIEEKNNFMKFIFDGNMSGINIDTDLDIELPLMGSTI